MKRKKQQHSDIRYYATIGFRGTNVTRRGRRKRGSKSVESKFQAASDRLILRNCLVLQREPTTETSEHTDANCRSKRMQREVEIKGLSVTVKN